MSSGIYSIINIKTSQIYIGSAINLEKRKNQHLRLLRNNKHHNQHLQNSYNKYSKYNFEWYIIELVTDTTQLISREQFYIKKLDNGHNLYNICKDVPSSQLGTKRSDETKRKIGIASTGRKHSDETKRIISEKNSCPSDETTQKRVKAMTGQKRSAETKEKQRKSSTGRKHSEESKNKMRLTKLGIKPSKETRKKMSESRKGNKNALGLKHTTEARKKMSDASRKYWENKKMLDFRLYDYLDTQTSVTVIADSTSSLTNSRVTTMLCRVPEIILPQLNTHRVFSRNVASNRAKRFSVNAKNMTYKPAIWLENHKGMQSEKLLPEWKSWIANIIWGSSKISSYIHGYLLDKLGVSKQYSNRVTTPYRYTDYLVTSSSWDNFLYQRDDNHAQFEIQVVARKIRQALEESKSVLLKQDEWHLPFITERDKIALPAFKQIQVSVARCARTSYSTPKNSAGMKDIYDKDIALYDTLVNSKPPHLSPTEHQLLCDWPNVATSKSNIQGFTQFRKILESVQFSQERVSQYV